MTDTELVHGHVQRGLSGDFTSAKAGFAEETEEDVNVTS